MVRRAEKASRNPEDGRKYLLSGLMLATQNLNMVPESASTKPRLQHLLAELESFMPELSRNETMLSGLALLWYGAWLIPAEDSHRSSQLQTLLIETEASLQRVISESEDDVRERTEPKMSNTPANEAYVVALEAEAERLNALVEKLQNALIGIRDIWRSQPSIKAMREEKVRSQMEMQRLVMLFRALRLTLVPQNRARQRHKDDDHEAKPPLAVTPGSSTTHTSVTTVQNPVNIETEEDITKDLMSTEPTQPTGHDENGEIGPVSK